jgi:hypothetical protein
VTLDGALDDLISGEVFKPAAHGDCRQAKHLGDRRSRSVDNSSNICLLFKRETKFMLLVTRLPLTCRAISKLAGPSYTTAVPWVVRLALRFTPLCHVNSRALFYFRALTARGHIGLLALLDFRTLPVRFLLFAN